jgi:hypothetical protein
MFNFELIKTDLEETTLNGKTVLHIINNNLKQMITDHLLQKYGIKMGCTNKYFVAMNPVLDLELLRRHRHLVYVNTNQRIYLMVLSSFKDQSVCLMIDKQNMIFYVLKCQFSPSLYQGIVLEGEIIDSYFMISDFLVYLQKNITNHPLDKRLNLLQSIIAPKNYQYDSLIDPFQVIIKDFVEYPQVINFIQEHLSTLPYKNRVTGFIFRPVEHSNKNLIYNFYHKHSASSGKKYDTSVNLNQPQPIRINTERFKEVKFLLFETGNPDDYRLQLFSDNERLIDYDYALVNDMKTSQMLQKILDESSVISKSLGICFICRYYPTFEKWKPIQMVAESPDNLNYLV